MVHNNESTFFSAEVLSLKINSHLAVHILGHPLPEPVLEHLCPLFCKKTWGKLIVPSDCWPAPTTPCQTKFTVRCRGLAWHTSCCQWCCRCCCLPGVRMWAWGYLLVEECWCLVLKDLVEKHQTMIDHELPHWQPATLLHQDFGGGEPVQLSY